MEDDNDNIVTRKPKKVIKKPKWLTNDMVVAYALPVIDDDISNTFSEAIYTIMKIVSGSYSWRKR